MKIFKARSSDLYAGLYFSYQASYSSAYFSKASQVFMKNPPRGLYFRRLFCEIFFHTCFSFICYFLSYEAECLWNFAFCLPVIFWLLYNGIWQAGRRFRKSFQNRVCYRSLLDLGPARPVNLWDPYFLRQKCQPLTPVLYLLRSLP